MDGFICRISEDYRLHVRSLWREFRSQIAFGAVSIVTAAAICAAFNSLHYKLGYEVFVDGIVGPWFLRPWLDAADEGYEIHYIVLRAGRDETLKRAVRRAKLDRAVNTELVETMWKQFCSLEEYERNVIDTSHLSVKHTVLAVQKRIDEGTALLCSQ